MEAGKKEKRVILKKRKKPITSGNGRFRKVKDKRGQSGQFSEKKGNRNRKKLFTGGGNPSDIIV